MKTNMAMKNSTRLSYTQQTKFDARHLSSSFEIVATLELRFQ